MDRRKLQTLVLLAIAVVAVGACGLIDDTRPKVPVTVFGRNAAPAVAWVAVWPMTDPSASVGFGGDIGVGCLDAPVGSQVVVLDGSPGRLSRVVRVVIQGPARRE